MVGTGDYAGGSRPRAVFQECLKGASPTPGSIRIQKESGRSSRSRPVEKGWIWGTSRRGVCENKREKGPPFGRVGKCTNSVSPKWPHTHTRSSQYYICLFLHGVSVPLSDEWKSGCLECVLSEFAANELLLNSCIGSQQCSYSFHGPVTRRPSLKSSLEV